MHLKTDGMKINDDIRQVILDDLKPLGVPYLPDSDDDFWGYIIAADQVHNHRMVYMNEVVYDRVAKIGDHHIMYSIIEKEGSQNVYENAHLVEPRTETITFTTYKPIK